MHTVKLHHCFIINESIAKCRKNMYVEMRRTLTGFSNLGKNAIRVTTKPVECRRARASVRMAVVVVVVVVVVMKAWESHFVTTADTEYEYSFLTEAHYYV